MNRWPVHKAHFWETAPFFRLLLPLVFGIWGYYHTPLHLVPTGYPAIVALVSVVALLIVVVSKRSNPITSILTYLVFISVGMALSGFNDVCTNKDWFGNSIDESKTYVARITAIPSEKEKSWKIPVEIVDAVGEEGVRQVTGRAFVYLQKSEVPMLLHKYDTILLPGNWQPITDAGNPFEFSYSTYCAVNNIFHYQWCYDDEVRLFGACNPESLPATDRVNLWCMRQLHRYLHGHQAMGLLQAMLLGDEVNLDKEMRQSYAKTGIVHIIAISGGNVAMLFVVILCLLRWLKHKKYAWVKYLVAIPFVWFYVIMAGEQPSAVRAAVMFSILAGGYLLSKSHNSLNQLFATAFLLLVARPAWLFSLGFQLSFVAVLSIIVFYRPVDNLLTGYWRSCLSGATQSKLKTLLYRAVSGLWSVVAMSIAAEILIAPIVIYYFHSFPVMFIVANVAAYLFMGVILLAGILLVATSGVPVIAGGIASVTIWMVDRFGEIVVALQNIGPPSLDRLRLTTFELMITYVVIAGLGVLLLRKRKAGLAVSMSAACLLLCSFCVDEWVRLHRHVLVVYNAANVSHVELIKGRSYAVLHTDTSFQSNIAYATQPAHIGWGVSPQVQLPAQRDVVSIGGKELLLLNSDSTAIPRQHYDIVVLNYPAINDLDSVLVIANPELVVAGSCYNRQELMQVATACKKAGVSMYPVSDSGAFVLSD